MYVVQIIIAKIKALDLIFFLTEQKIWNIQKFIFKYFPIYCIHIACRLFNICNPISFIEIKCIADLYFASRKTSVSSVSYSPLMTNHGISGSINIITIITMMITHTVDVWNLIQSCVAFITFISIIYYKIKFYLHKTIIQIYAY